MLKHLITSLLMLLALSSCQLFRQGDDELSGRVVLWHGWTPEEMAILEEALDEFREIHPQVTVASLALPRGDLLEQYKQSADDGLAPDLLLGSSDWVRELADSGRIYATLDSYLALCSVEPVVPYCESSARQRSR